MINKCARKDNAPYGLCIVKKISKHKERIGHEMRLIA